MWKEKQTKRKRLLRKISAKPICIHLIGHFDQCSFSNLLPSKGAHTNRTGENPNPRNSENQTLIFSVFFIFAAQMNVQENEKLKIKTTTRTRTNERRATHINTPVQKATKHSEKKGKPERIKGIGCRHNVTIASLLHSECEYYMISLLK